MELKELMKILLFENTRITITDLGNKDCPMLVVYQSNLNNTDIPEELYDRKVKRVIPYNNEYLIILDDDGKSKNYDFIPLSPFKE